MQQSRAPFLPTLCAVLGTPLRQATPLPRAIWQALGLEPMTKDYQRLGDKEAPSPASQPLYLRLQSIPDPESVELVQCVLFRDREEHNIDVNDMSVPKRKCTKLRIAPE